MATERQSQEHDKFETSEDAFLDGTLVIEQARHGSRAGVDAIFLAASTPAKPGDSVLDLGSGSGIVALAVASRVAGVQVAGIELDPMLCELARRNAARNGLSDRAAFVQGDITGPARALVGTGFELESFDHAVANPPFLSVNEARSPKNAQLQRAHMLEPGDLERWIKCLTAFVKPGGSVTIVHRADALPQLLSHCEGRIGRVTVYPLFPRQGASASRILIQGIKGSRAPLRISPGMVLHASDSQYTNEAEAVLRRGATLDVTADKSHLHGTAVKHDAC